MSNQQDDHELRQPDAETAGASSGAYATIDAVETHSENAGDAGASDSVVLQGQLAELEQKAQQNWDLYVRAKAEMDNIRRRGERDLENAHKFALERFVQDLLPVRDSLELAVAASKGEDPAVAIREGVELTLKMLWGVLEKHGCQEINPMGESFNPDLHQAVSMQESADAAPDTVLAVMQKGYALNDRLIRPAMVVVSRGT